MLYITFDSHSVREWHVGQPNPVHYSEVNAVREIQADGHELEHIKNMFGHPKNIFGDPTYPGIPHGQVIRLFGDFAKTIVANL